MRGSRFRAARPAALALLLATALTAASCSASPAEPHATAGASSPVAGGAGGSAGPSAGPSPGSTGAVTIELLGPDAPVTPGEDEVPLVVRITRNGAPLTDATTTFEVQAGPAVFPDGFEAAQTDDTGVATARSLATTGPGTVRIQVSTGDDVGTVTVEVR